MGDVKAYEISSDRKKMLVSEGRGLFTFWMRKSKPPRSGGCQNASQSQDRHVPLDILTNPRAEFHEMFLDAWRLERDYFYDRNMQGLDWPAIRDRYLPLVDRVSDRDELNDVIAQMVSELSALHIFVFGGDARKPAGPDGYRLARRRVAARRKGRRLRRGPYLRCMIRICLTWRPRSRGRIRWCTKVK